jgi:hypothetical protein
MPQEWDTPMPSKRPDIFPEFEKLETALPKPLPGDPEMPDEEMEEEQIKVRPFPRSPRAWCRYTSARTGAGTSVLEGCCQDASVPHAHAPTFTHHYLPRARWRCSCARHIQPTQSLFLTHPPRHGHRRHPLATHTAARLDALYSAAATPELHASSPK